MSIRDLIAGEKHETSNPEEDRQDRAPILEALQTYLRAKPSSFDIPGHQGGRATAHAVTRLIGSSVFAADTTPQKGLDDRLEKKRVRQRAERLAAKLWGAQHCFFSTNGTSLSNHAAVCSVAGPGETVLVSRNSHKSLIGSLIIANVKPVFLEPSFDDFWDVGHGVAAAELERKLAEHPDTKGVFIIAPTYFGITPDIRRLAELCHAKKIPLVVDEAWGPHFAFHPEMPTSAIRRGADITTGSIHKTLAALEQASFILLHSDLVAPDRMNLAYDLFETTSPSGPILASIDGTRRQFAQEGEKLVQDALDLARETREAIAKIDGFRPMRREILDGDGRHSIDETKLLFDISELGINGYEAEDWLMREKKIALGLSDERRLLIIFTVGSDRKSAAELVKALHDLAKWARDGGRDKKGRRCDIPRERDLVAEQAMTPAEAFYARGTERVALDKAVGRIAAEMLSPYPPGIPRILPGQKITDAQVQYMRQSMEIGAFPLDATDLELNTVRVVA